jgi:hypothetical protein
MEDNSQSSLPTSSISVMSANSETLNITPSNYETENSQDNSRHTLPHSDSPLPDSLTSSPVYQHKPQHYSTDIFKGLNPNLVINRLDDHILVLDVLKQWGKSTKWKLFVKEDPVDKKPAATPQESSTMIDSLSKSKSSTHKAPILICASEKNNGI